MLLPVLLFLAILGLLVFVHELGHFLAARKLGIAVEEFGFGFPPRIFGIKGKNTLYSLNWIPIGGFVKIKGEQGDQASEQDSFASRKAWQRIWVLSAGVIFNILLAAILYSGGFMLGLPQSITDADIQDQKVLQSQIVISDVVAESPAAEAGLRLGDELVSLAGEPVVSLQQTYEYLDKHRSQPVEFSILRDGQGQLLTAQAKNNADGKMQFGIGFVRLATIQYPFFEAIGRGIMATINVLIAITVALGFLLYKIFTFQGVGADVSGPVGVAVLTADVARLGWIHLINFVAVLSINLAVINILPFPALDGGRIVFVLFEKIRGRAVSELIEQRVHTTGFVLLLLLMALVTYRDIIRYGADIWSGLTKVFS